MHAIGWAFDTYTLKEKLQMGSSDTRFGAKRTIRRIAADNLCVRTCTVSKTNVVDE